MGAWGAGSFENDTALDWAATVKTIVDVRKPFERLKMATDKHSGGGDMTVDGSMAEELVAAAETVAMLMGREIPEFPEDLRDRLANSDDVDDLLFHQARNAVLHVFRHSELTELWDEATENGDENEWTRWIVGLIDRLNPDIEYIPWEIDQIKESSGGSPENCAFCNKSIDPAEMFGATVYDYSDINENPKGIYFHLVCLSSRMHPAHALHNMKFDPDNLPDLDKL